MSCLPHSKNALLPMECTQQIQQESLLFGHKYWERTPLSPHHFWKASLGPQPKTLTHELVSPKLPSKFSFQETEDFLNHVCKHVCRFLKKGGKFPYMRDKISMPLRNKIYDAKMMNGFLQKWDRISEESNMYFLHSFLWDIYDRRKMGIPFWFY